MGPCTLLSFCGLAPARFPILLCPVSVFSLDLLILPGAGLDPRLLLDFVARRHQAACLLLGLTPLALTIIICFHHMWSPILVRFALCCSAGVLFCVVVPGWVRCLPPRRRLAFRLAPRFLAFGKQIHCSLCLCHTGLCWCLGCVGGFPIGSSLGALLLGWCLVVGDRVPVVFIA